MSLPALPSPPTITLGGGVWAAFEGDTLVLTQELGVFAPRPVVARIALGPEALRLLDAYLWLVRGVHQRAQEAADG